MFKIDRIVQRNHRNHTVLSEVEGEEEKRAIMRVMMRKRMKGQRVEGVLTNCALQRKFSKRLDRESRKINTDFSVKFAMRIITITFTVNFVSRSTQRMGKMRMTTNGLDVTIVKDGYL